MSPDPNSRLLAGGRLACACTDGIGRLVIDRPERKNALDQEMWQALPGAIEWLAGRAGARVVVLSGAGNDFSAGADIGEFDTVRRDAATARFYEATNSAAFGAVREAPVPVIAAIRGICFGGAFGLAAAADFRLGDASARFAVPAARLGLAYPADAVSDIVHALGAQRAGALLSTAGEMSANEAKDTGFLMELVAPGTLEDAVDGLAGKIAAAAPLSVKASRAAIAAVLSGDAEAMQAARQLGDLTFESEDYAEGRRAFREKRKPVFSGH